jgi:hypothetical protein
MTPLALGCAALLSAGLLAGCAAQDRESHASLAQRAACSRRADSVFGEQHREAVFASDAYVSSTRDAPFSGAGLPGVPDAGLADRYQRDRVQSDCLDGIDGAPAPTPAAAAPAVK